MLPTKRGSIRILRLFGIDVLLHWSWFVLAVWRFQNGDAIGMYEEPAFYAYEILALFGIVLMHEFGHALACKQVGGVADQIILWPFGGVAYVLPPQRAGAQLWSIAAGPLVNLILLPVLYGYLFVKGLPLFGENAPDWLTFVRALFLMNAGLLAFNLLPIYPLDGGQILRSVLWFFLGRARSLKVATAIGFAGVFALGMCALYFGSIWLGILTFFVYLNCSRGWKQGQALHSLERAARYDAYACPRCTAPPPRGEFWVCNRCRNKLDLFATEGVCPHCRTTFADAQCANCQHGSPLAEWRTTALAGRIA
jgi:Zn-dependent protease